MNAWHRASLAITLALALPLGACARHDQSEQHYVSPQIHGQGARINLDQVQQAFWNTKASDFNQWMSAFEKRVNQIYAGSEIVSVDADRKNNRLVVVGYIDKAGKPGFQPSDDKLFTIEQTGQAADNQVPYRVSDGYGQPYYQGHHSLLDNPFLQAFFISHMFNSWGGHYYTSPSQVIILHDYRNTYRQSPAWQSQQAANRSFASRYKQKEIGGGFESKRQFGNGGFSSGTTQKRSWFGGNRSTDGNSSSGGWGGRRSSGSFGGSSGWGSRRSSGFGGSHSFGGRRR